MISDKSSLASRLGWMMTELEGLIQSGQEKFALYIDEPDERALEQALDAWRDILGVLDVLGAEGVFMLAREITLLLSALHEGKVEHKEDAHQCCVEGMVQLMDYLRHLQDGYVDLPVIILPTLNNLRAARDAELLSEHLVFLPSEEIIDNEQLGTDEYIALVGGKLLEASKRVRLYMQKALLQWYKGGDVTQSLGAISKVSSKMITLHAIPRLRALWWVNAALAQALEQHKLERNAAVKMLLGRMEREIKRFGELGEGSYNQTVPDELLKNLLYYVGLSEQGAPLADRVKEVYRLDLYLPSGDSLEALRSYYTTPGRELWQAVADSLQDELKQSIHIVEDINAQGDDASALLLKLAGRNSNMSQTLNMLGLNRASTLSSEFADELAAKSKQAQRLTQDELLETSTFYLKLERVINEYAESGYDITEQVFVEDGISQDLQTSRDVLRAALAELNRATAELAAFHQEGGSFFRLHDVIKNLRDIAGTLVMLEMDEVAPLPNGVAYYLQNDLRDKRRDPGADELGTVADIITLLEVVLNAIINNEDHLILLPTGYEALQRLDSYTELDLVTYSHLDEAQALLNSKKKAQRQMPRTLLQKARMSH